MFGALYYPFLKIFFNAVAYRAKGFLPLSPTAPNILVMLSSIALKFLSGVAYIIKKIINVFAYSAKKLRVYRI
jgi:hypothetical protein